MPRRNTPRHKHKRKQVVDFRIKFTHIIIASGLSLVFLLVNPYPAPFTPDNMYQSFVYKVFQVQAELTSEKYVNDILSQNGEFDESAKSLSAIYDNEAVVNPSQSPSSHFLTSVLPAKTTDGDVLAYADVKWIEVDLSDQKLIAWENGQKVYEFLVSTGRPWTPTLTGDFRIWIKLRYARMRGGSTQTGDYYDVRNVPYVMYYDRGYGLHGAYWHNNFGQVMSHGCVNIKPEEAGLLYEWATPAMNGKTWMKASPENPGTRVVIHD